MRTLVVFECEVWFSSSYGLRVIYYWWDVGQQFWLFTIYDKDEMSDLTKAQRETLKRMIKNELEERRKR